MASIAESAKTKVYRLTHVKRAGDLSGEGSRRVGGRWNSRGVPALYTSESIALSVLEVLVHLQLIDTLPEMYYTTVIEVNEVISERIETLPSSLASCRAVGDGLLNDVAILGFWVPSVIVPREDNLVLNPRCSRFAEAVSVVDSFAQRLDARLLQ